MLFFWLKVIASALLIAAISELSKRNVLFAGVMASLPLVSLLSIVWLYLETKSTEKVITLSHSIFFMVLPSLLFFLILPIFLRKEVPFFIALFLSCLILGGAYSGFIWLYDKVGIKL
jgi:hypothetical protein